MLGGLLCPHELLLMDVPIIKLRIYISFFVSEDTVFTVVKAPVDILPDSREGPIREPIVLRAVVLARGCENGGVEVHVDVVVTLGVSIRAVVGITIIEIAFARVGHLVSIRAGDGMFFVQLLVLLDTVLEW
jgi:hypothetical protein